MWRWQRWPVISLQLTGVSPGREVEGTHAVRKRKHYLFGPTRTPSVILIAFGGDSFEARRGSQSHLPEQSCSHPLALCLLNQTAQCRPCCSTVIQTRVKLPYLKDSNNQIKASCLEHQHEKTSFFSSVVVTSVESNVLCTWPQVTTILIL